MLHLYRDVFASFHAHDVKYVVIGGTAATLHGLARMTFDVDILIEATLDNARRLLKALLEARVGTAALTTPENLLAHEISILRDYIRIDIQTRTKGIDFPTAWNHKETRIVEGQQFYIVSREHLLASKKASGRPIDLADVQALEGLAPPPTQ